MTRQWFFSLLMFAWLTIGYAVVHSVISLWGISVLQSIWPASIPIESLHITEKGEPLIQSYDTNYSHVTFRRLDGTLVPDTLGLNRTFVNPVSLTMPDRAEPFSWEQRLAPFHDFQRPATCWYLIAPPNREGAAYFVGYDRLSRRQIGYLGVNGFSIQPPDINQSFPIATSSYSAFHGVMAATIYPSYYVQAVEPNGDHIELNHVPMGSVASDAVWILSRGIIYEIRLGLRTVRTLLEDRPEMRYLARSNVKTSVQSGGTPDLQLLVRTDSGLLILDPESGKVESLILEPAPPQTQETFYQLSNNRRMLVNVATLNRLRRSQQYTIYWLDAEGGIERRAEIELRVQTSELFAHPDAALCLSFPLPIVSCGAWLIAPFMPKESTEVQTFSGKFWQFLSDFKTWLAFSLMAGILTGWACRRRERDIFGRSGWFWPILVGACGWFGWMGYVCLHPLPARLPQGRWLPAQPEPARPLGTEIFA